MENAERSASPDSSIGSSYEELSLHEQMFLDEVPDYQKKIFAEIITATKATKTAINKAIEMMAADRAATTTQQPPAAAKPPRQRENRRKNEEEYTNSEVCVVAMAVAFVFMLVLCVACAQRRSQTPTPQTTIPEVPTPKVPTPPNPTPEVPPPQTSTPKVTTPQIQLLLQLAETVRNKYTKDAEKYGGKVTPYALCQHRALLQYPEFNKQIGLSVCEIALKTPTPQIQALLNLTETVQNKYMKDAEQNGGQIAADTLCQHKALSQINGFNEQIGLALCEAVFIKN